MKQTHLSSKNPQLDRVVLAPTGTLLVTWRNPDGRIAAFRSRMAAEFPGASDRQAAIIHTTLLRVVTAERLGEETVEAVARACDEWTREVGWRLGAAAEMMPVVACVGLTQFVFIASVELTNQ
jgi:hypothetical protein